MKYIVHVGGDMPEKVEVEAERFEQSGSLVTFWRRRDDGSHGSDQVAAFSTFAMVYVESV